MKKLLLILLTLPFTAFAQERISRDKPQVSFENIGELKEATGWMLNPEGDWVSLQNTIPVYLSGEYKSLLTYEQYGLGTDNFISYELREGSFGNQEFYVLLKKFRSGYYNYPTIKEEWRSNESIYAYVFAKSELNKISTVKFDQINMVEINLLDMVELRYVSRDENPIELIESKMDIPGNSKLMDKFSLVLHFAPYPDKGIIQFQIYAKYGKSGSIVSGIVSEHKPGNAKIYLKEKLFEHCYYETDYANFLNFLPLNKRD
ncbi:hypothetical protein [Roseivirga thermotolerans]|uniref:Uncharacterized protein n=1 Tax=Roseivirga thermotolerans TaxID=1758176 RepID=A0ABQ3IA67_9BACT|nr:hypothetical protein [Roseivirga thermotolerans]GHE65074.1 hypothetical protein GCM10011340_20140 [Roseivirga thermotolerans]